ncbi:hypothetical protein G7074_06710 [Pedobacter sp. HDW13]|uniref:hypothetical protein n=1 Tax=unclassified Pedobacter TaxID=2628915 RepID=UPI000F5A53A9|nr:MULTISPECIES: hypothetical protein [unclassified Pedobacter]QIL39001.1 hypothetical protein G7074_06710 [Pedobacter sp. HDW13]RQO72641.1 hypothetical protein DBR40_15150 [Pedobacter sp. KBW01]
MNINIEDNNVKQNMLEASQLVWRVHGRKLLIISLIFFVLGIVFYGYFYNMIKNTPTTQDLDREIDLEILFICWMISLLFLIRFFRVKRNFFTTVKRDLNQAFNQSSTRKIIITDEGVEGITEHYRSFAKWEIITKFKVYDKYISITNLLNPSPFFIPIHLMAEEEYKSLLFYLRSTKKETK